MPDPGQTMASSAAATAVEAAAGEVVGTDSLWAEALDIWFKGGWAMIAIAVIALVIFGVGIQVWLKLRRTGFLAVPERTWRKWIEQPGKRKGSIGELLDFVTGARTLAEIGVLFEQLRASEAAPFARDLRVMRVCVSAAPLVGLLGTVTGMLATFGALSAGSGGDKTMGLVAAGISEALITTETGLVIALPGLFFQYHVARTYERYKAFLAHLQTVCTQELYRRIRRERAVAVTRAARGEVARALLQRAVS